MIFLFLYSTFPHSAFSHSAFSHSPIPMIRFSHLLWSSPVVHTMLDLLHQMSLTLHSMVPVHTLTHSPSLTHSFPHTLTLTHTLIPSHTHPHTLSLFPHPPPPPPPPRTQTGVSVWSSPCPLSLTPSLFLRVYRRERYMYSTSCNTCI